MAQPASASPLLIDLSDRKRPMANSAQGAAAAPKRSSHFSTGVGIGRPTAETTMPSAIDTGSGTVLAGDTVRFEDDATVYLVTVGVAAPGTITISPGLTQDQTDNKTVTILSQTSRVTVLCP